jgi:hypothetical protein
MARRVFFSFHYQQDIWRVSRVRNSWVTKDRQTNTFMDAASWESVKKKGPVAIKGWIDRQLNGTGVTVVLIGQFTAQRRYVTYEIQQSVARGNGLLGVYIHRMKDGKGKTSRQGANPLDNFMVKQDFLFGLAQYDEKLSNVYKTYDWEEDDGYRNIDDWIEEAAEIAGR